MAENHHQWHAIGECIHDGRKRIAAPRPFGHHRDTDLARAARIPVGDIHSRLLMAGQDQRHLSVLMQRVEDRQDIVSRQRRDEFHSLDLENIHDGVGNSHKWVTYLVENFLKKPSSSSFRTNR